MQPILLKTTVPHRPDNWHIGHFSRLAEHLRALTDEHGAPLFAVDARDRVEDERGNDPELVYIAQSAYRQLWLFAVEEEDGLSFADLMGINLFRQQGGGLLLSRGPGDTGASLYLLDTVGAAQCFNTVNPEADPDRRCSDRDDQDWPCHDAGAAGTMQSIQALEPVHSLLRRDDGRVIRQLPASPTEGAVEVPETAGQFARVIATGQSRRSGRAFNIAVAFERREDRWGELVGRAVAEASFQRFSDFPGDPEADFPGAMADTLAYYRNIALWLRA